ncbi:MAG: NUDIX domain-containing protein [Minisyncoccia bacterium]
MSIIAVVDENDVVIGSKDRTELAPGDLYRVSALWLTNSHGEVLMAQRAHTKLKDPGSWGPAVAGTVEEDEDYDTNMLKEIQEELGISIPLERLVRGAKTLIRKGESGHFVQWYTSVLDIATSDLVLQKEEVATVAWFTVEELRRKIEETPEEFTPSASLWLELFLSSKSETKIS